jgi:hypothetical protein
VGIKKWGNAVLKQRFETTDTACLSGKQGVKFGLKKLTGRIQIALAAK